MHHAHELKDNGIIVNRVNIAGGEPSLVSPLVVRILSAIEKNVLMMYTYISIQNGVTDQAQDLMQHPRWDSISMSLHHYDTERLSELYGCKLSTQLFQFKGVNKQIVKF